MVDLHTLILTPSLTRRMSKKMLEKLSGPERPAEVVSES